ncbi:hypothetical protein [Dinghuibacter silviterrae]|uniref:Uncharacterized protein n=1 Tax=Dinghuibacter silviterrae TaxID=1539049 RepID=A0A4V3GM60_9BACT|nr:hypothetical protein [Dinghuibacter silviterrae]TDX02183.1 hypothetical protein EDB95_3234 [Dinghuibacter silviterrae]
MKPAYGSLLWGLIIMAFNGGCKKPGFNDLGGSNVINGVVVLYDTLALGYGYAPVSGQTVYLQDPSDTTGYLYSSKSNPLGQFSFNGFDSTARYRIYTSFDSNHVHYTGNLLYNDYNASFLHAWDSLVVSIDESSQNGIFYEVFDSLGGRISNANLYIFTSKLLWQVTDSTGVGSNYPALKSDVFGRCLQMHVAGGLYYYIIAIYKVKPGVSWKGVDTVWVNNTGIRKKTITLRP